MARIFLGIITGHNNKQKRESENNSLFDSVIFYCFLRRPKFHFSANHFRRHNAVQ